MGRRKGDRLLEKEGDTHSEREKAQTERGDRHTEEGERSPEKERP